MKKMILLITCIVGFTLSGPSDSIKIVTPAFGTMFIDTSKITTEILPKKPTNWSKIKDLFL
jgi:hypothetical protein